MVVFSKIYKKLIKDLDGEYLRYMADMLYLNYHNTCGVYMNKQEFLEKLRLSLSGKISATLVEENVAYYEEYINVQIRQGQAESVVLQMLGDPRHIAKSIITANDRDESGSTEDNNQNSKSQEWYYAQKRNNNSPRVVKVHGWLALLVLIVVIVLIISVVFSVISALLPVMILVGIIMFFVKLFRDWLN